MKKNVCAFVGIYHLRGMGIGRKTKITQPQGQKGRFTDKHKNWLWYKCPPKLKMQEINGNKQERKRHS